MKERDGTRLRGEERWEARRRKTLERLNFFDGGPNGDYLRRDEQMRLEREVELVKTRRHPGC